MPPKEELKFFYYAIIKWFSSDWWKYILATRVDDEVSWYKVVKCRIKDHPCGVVWHNVYTLEPSMTCRECGDDLG